MKIIFVNIQKCLTKCLAHGREVHSICDLSLNTTLFYGSSHLSLWAPGSAGQKLPLASRKLAFASQSQGTAPPPHLATLTSKLELLRCPMYVGILKFGVPRPRQTWISSSEASKRPLPPQSWGYPQLSMGHRPLPTLAPQPQVTG